MASSIQKLGPAIPIQCHAWSADRQTVAVSHNDKEDYPFIVFDFNVEK
jgi:hypothetical protein